MDTRSAAATVLRIPELLEQILLSFDEHIDNPHGRPLMITLPDHVRSLKALLVNQRVNKTFQATINESPLLQQALFFKQITDRAEAPIVVNLTAFSGEFVARSGNRAQVTHCWTDQHHLELVIKHAPKQKRAKTAMVNRAAGIESWRRMFLTSKPMEATVFVEGSNGWVTGDCTELTYGPDATLGDMLSGFSMVPRKTCSTKPRRMKRKEVPASTRIVRQIMGLRSKGAWEARGTYKLGGVKHMELHFMHDSRPDKEKEVNTERGSTHLRVSQTVM